MLTIVHREPQLDCIARAPPPAPAAAVVHKIPHVRRSRCIPRSIPRRERWRLKRLNRRSVAAFHCSPDRNRAIQTLVQPAVGVLSSLPRNDRIRAVVQRENRHLGECCTFCKQFVVRPGEVAQERCAKDGNKCGERVRQLRHRVVHHHSTV